VVTQHFHICMKLEIPERHKMCCICRKELQDPYHFIDHGVVLFSCVEHRKITNEMMDLLSKKLPMYREITNEKA